MQAPCKDCQERHYLCHSSCEKYREYDDYRKAILKKKASAAKALEDLIESHRNGRRRR